jgi:DNA-binding MarR family transcriptional regulator
MDGRLPLPALLSQVLVAFTIECDNEAEHRIPHTTTDQGSASKLFVAPWLTSIVMWTNCMQHLDDEPITFHELERRARTSTNLSGMQRWGYIFLAPDPADRRPKPPRSAWLIHPTAAGQASRQVWRTLPAAIEKRWRERFGRELVDRLREGLYPVIEQLDLRLPDCLPILSYGLKCKAPQADANPLQENEDHSTLSLFTLLSRALLAFALEFEEASRLSLAIFANPLRVLNKSGVRLRDLPILTGVSKESISMAMGILRKAKLVIEQPDPAGGPFKLVCLTPAGVDAQRACIQIVREIEERWRARFGAQTVDRLREPLEELAGDSTAEGSPLFECLTPHPGGWRAAIRPPKTLPHFPMVLHRGGYPDGS